MRKQTRYLTEAAMIAAIYVVLVLVLRPISFGAMQVRIAEALTILPYFTPAAIPGLSVGCLLANILGGADILDIVFGTLATLLGAVFSYRLRAHKFLVWLPPVAANTLIVPFVLRAAYGESQPIPLLMLTIGAGELIACCFIGTLLLLTLEKYRTAIFNR